jgi:SWI/SNF-related matrix-associated actin-dependent regulator of chromatin subfamily A member 5
VVVQDEALGEVAVDRRALEEEAHNERLIAESASARQRASEGGRKFGHEDHCGHCGEDMRVQTATVRTEVSADGRVVKKRRIAGTSNFLCPGCPVALHGRCADLYGLGGDGRMSCPQHRCGICERSGSMAGGLLFRCVGCLVATCFDCAERLGVLDKLQFLTDGHGEWEDKFGFYPPGTYEYFRCPECTVLSNQ